MNYPLISEYVEAIKLAEDNLEQLSYLRPVLDRSGNPVMSSGNFAVVFKMKDERDGKFYALKCFIKDQERRTEAYKQIADELEYVSKDFITSIKYLDKELFVDTSNSDVSEFPVLMMDWVEGLTLDKYIHEHLQDQYALHLITFQFCRLASWLMAQPFAHGDLKPDNIIVKADGTLVLVDYDGMFVPAMKGQKAREIGSPDFRHPLRTIDDFNEHIDDFSLATIAMQLYAIALQPNLLTSTKGETLLLSEVDYRNLSKCQMMPRLLSMVNETEFAKLLGLFFLSYSENSLSKVSFRAFQISKPLKDSYATASIKNNLPERYGKQNIVFTINDSIELKLILVKGNDKINSFYLAETSVTQELWQFVMGYNPSIFKGNQKPVDSISWYDANKFTKKLSALMNVDFRLPTSSEWEFAAKGGLYSKGYIYSGSNELTEVGWCSSNSGHMTHNVKLKKPNEIGLYDMSGNTFEWCSDPYLHNGEERKVARGGTVLSGYADSNCMNEHFSYPEPFDNSEQQGMRVALDCPYQINHSKETVLKEIVGSFFIDERDGNKYQTVKIGNQIWMAENLRHIINLGRGAYVYDLNSTDVEEIKSSKNYKTYGLLYNYETAQLACPDGWHIPSDNEWKELEMFLGMKKEVCDLLSYDTQPNNISSFNNPRKGIDINIILENDSQIESNNSIRFNARLGGWRTYKSTYNNIGTLSRWWSSTRDVNKSKSRDFRFFRSVSSGLESIIRASCHVDCCLSIRCIKNK